MFKKQFLFTKEKNELIDRFLAIKIGDYNLQYHEELEFTKVINLEVELYLLGEVFSYEFPKQSNKEILEILIKQTTDLDVFLKELSKLYGQFVLIYKNIGQLIILNDACAQSEIYYNEGCTAFASQVKLLQKSISLTPHTNDNAKKYYKSSQFKKSKLFINNTTHAKNVKHLFANHYIEINKKKLKRFYPINTRKRISINKASILIAEMLKGYLKAISLRYKICLPVTAGYDSRVLFLASLGLDCDYFVTKFNDMDDNHNDLTISRQLVNGIYKKKFEIVNDHVLTEYEFDSNYKNSLDFPLFISPDLVGDKVIINGNISEIGRNLFYYLKWVTPKNLNIVNYFELNPFISDEYSKWLKVNKSILKHLKYNILDIFAWEQYMGIVHGKSKSHTKTLGVKVMSPYNSRALLDIMLSTNRNKRDNKHNILYNAIIAQLSNNNLEVINLPINPSRNKSRYLLYKKMRIHKLWSNLRTVLLTFKRKV